MHFAISISNCERSSLLRDGILVGDNRDAIDRARALARETSGADFEIDFEDAG